MREKLHTTIPTTITENEVDDNDNDIGPGQTSDGPASAARIHCQ